DVSSMRRRMRAELDRSDDALFDLKQGEGGLVDLEFLLQFLLLRESGTHASLRTPRASPAIIDVLHAANVFDANTRAALQVAHATLLDAGMRCTLDRRRRRVARDERIELAREAIRDAVRAQGLRFDGEKGAAEKGSE
ncbi:MAG: glutamine-synthetase adenylyltransferase, partial [Thermomonas sp.]